jgi:hypothetical protein
MQVGLSSVTVAPPSSGGCAILLVDAVSGDCGRGIARAGAGTLTVRLSLDAPGLPQLLALVERHPPAHELHLLCPGAGDRIMLGTTPITLQSLRQDRQTRAAFIALGRHLGDGTTLVLGGANVGCGDAGQAFLQALADLLEVEVSALVRVAPSDGRSRLT